MKDKKKKPPEPSEWDEACAVLRAWLEANPDEENVPAQIVDKLDEAKGTKPTAVTGTETADA